MCCVFFSPPHLVNLQKLQQSEAAAAEAGAGATLASLTIGTITITKATPQKVTTKFFVTLRKPIEY